MDLSPELLARARDWTSLKRWERRELGQDLRRLGLSYREIQEVIPVARGTLSAWCRDIELDGHQVSRLEYRGIERLKAARVGEKLRAAHVARSGEIRLAARAEGRRLLHDPFWAAGVVAYWSEGAKRQNEVMFSNSDPGLVRLFIEWAERYLGVTRD